jgi:hypothetical protein
LTGWLWLFHRALRRLGLRAQHFILVDAKEICTNLCGDQLRSQALPNVHPFSNAMLICIILHRRDCKVMQESDKICGAFLE